MRFGDDDRADNDAFWERRNSGKDADDFLVKEKKESQETDSLLIDFVHFWRGLDAQPAHWETLCDEKKTPITWNNTTLYNARVTCPACKDKMLS